MKNIRAEQGGVALIYAIFVAFIAAALSATMLDYSTSDHKLTKTKRYVTEARYAAEGGIEEAKKLLINAKTNWVTPLPSSGATTINNIQVNYTITPTGFTVTNADASGVQKISEYFEITATGRVQGYQETIHRIISADSTPIFQYAVFYNDDLEIIPGKTMTISGRVHTNKNMYLGSTDAKEPLLLDSNYVHAVGNIYRDLKAIPGTSLGAVKIRKWVADPFNAAEPLQYFQMNNKTQMAAVGVNGTIGGFDSNFTSGYDADGDGTFTNDPNDWLPWSSGALEYWKEPTGYTNGTGNTVKSADHGVGLAVTPNASSIAMYEPVPAGDFDLVNGQYVPAAGGPGTGTHNKGYYHQNADLVITMNPSATSWTAYSNGVDVSAQLQSVVSISTIYDRRQDAAHSGQKIDTLDIDMVALNNSGFFPANGLLYAAGEGNGQDTAINGVRLKSGSDLQSGLTVASEGAVYIQGDYNTQNKKGASVIGDAVNLLSNSWDDSKTAGTLPVAIDTTYNVAIITGNKDTVPGTSYNGGFENLPRFHENWTGINCNITGSFVNTWLSQYATGKWFIMSDYYTAPTRNWSYDTAFNNINNLPPFTPLTVTGTDVVVWN